MDDVQVADYRLRTRAVKSDAVADGDVVGVERVKRLASWDSQPKQAAPSPDPYITIIHSIQCILI